MKAAQLDRYSREGRLTVREVAVPEPVADEVLIKVRAAAVNPLELLIVRGSIRLIQDYRLPRRWATSARALSSGSEAASGSSDRAMPSIHAFRWSGLAPLPNTSP